MKNWVGLNVLRYSLILNFTHMSPLKNCKQIFLGIIWKLPIPLSKLPTNPNTLTKIWDYIYYHNLPYNLVRCMPEFRRQPRMGLPFSFLDSVGCCGGQRGRRYARLRDWGTDSAECVHYASLGGCLDIHEFF